MIRKILFRSISLACLSLCTGAAAAATPEQVEAFNAAWHEYIELQSTTNFDATAKAAKTALETAQLFMPAGDERLPVLKLNYGTALMRAGSRGDAEETLSEALDEATQLYGSDSEKLVPFLMSRGDSRAYYGKASGLISDYNDARDIAAEVHGADSLEYADITLRAGTTILDVSQTRNAIRFLKEAREIYLDRLGPNEHQVGVASFYLGKAELIKGNEKTAIDDFLAALQGFSGDDEETVQSRLVTHGYLVHAYESRGESEKATEHCLAIGARRSSAPDSEFMPVFRQAPVYPSSMLVRRQQGHVDLSFTVDESGFVRDIEVIDTEGNSAFEEPAIDAVEGFRYAPRFVDGEPVATTGVTSRISFKLEN